MRDILIYFTSPVVLLAVILVLVMVYFIINRPKEDEEEEIITTKDMLKDVNEERRNAGLYEIPEMNTRVNTGNLARMDKSFKSVPDFFRQLLSKKEKE